MNRGNITIGWMKISMGGTACTIVDPKVIFSTALLCGASAIVISHNHPSGNTQPSDKDRLLTKLINGIGEVLGIGLLDHIIVTADNYYSFSDNMELK